MKELTEYLFELKTIAEKIALGRGYFRHEGDSLYFRCGLSPAAGGMAIILANVEVAAHQQNMGRFTRYLETVEDFAKEEGLVVVVELVNNPILSSALLRRDYKKVIHPLGHETGSYLKTSGEW